MERQEIKKVPADAGNDNKSTPMNTQPAVEIPREPKVFPDNHRTVFYGRLLESIFANPTYRQVLYETATKELKRNE